MIRSWPLAAAAGYVCGLAMLVPGVGYAADLELGEYLSSECTTCHQNNGASDAIPTIAGWPASFMVMVLEQYRVGERQNPVMRSVVQNLNEEEIAALAAWFEQVEAAQ